MVDKLIMMEKCNTLSEVPLLQNDHSIYSSLRRVEFEPEQVFK